MKKATFLLACLIALPSIGLAGSLDKSCSVKSCDVGDNLVTYATKSEPYYACPTRELSEYTTLVLGMVSTHLTITGKLPNISDTTGEPEYLDTKDGPNQTRLMLDHFRKAAGVRTFDQATAACKVGKAGMKVAVMNNPSDKQVIWVRGAKNETFWLPKSHVDKK